MPHFYAKVRVPSKISTWNLARIAEHGFREDGKLRNGCKLLGLCLERLRTVTFVYLDSLCGECLGCPLMRVPRLPTDVSASAAH